MSDKRELITVNSIKYYVRRNPDGTFKEFDRVDKSLRQDVKQRAKRTVPPGQGDRGDQKRRTKKK